MDEWVSRRHGEQVKRITDIFPQFLRSRPSENVTVASAAGAGKVGHVVDKSQDRNADLTEHEGSFPGVDQRYFLRGGDDNGASHRNVLRDGQLSVSRSGRHVDDQVIQGGPVNLA